jgi:hypothetical protein
MPEIVANSRELGTSPESMSGMSLLHPVSAGMQLLFSQRRMIQRD